MMAEGGVAEDGGGCSLRTGRSSMRGPAGAARTAGGVRGAAGTGALMALMAVLLLLLVTTPTAADCPDACSGHGTCQSWSDFCACYDGWQGHSCAERVCAFGLAWIDVPAGDLDTDNRLDSGYFDLTAADGARPAGTVHGTALNPQFRPAGWWERHPAQLYGAAADGTLPLRARSEEGHFYAECSSRGLCDRVTGECACFTGYGGAACNRTVCANDCSGHGVCKSVRQITPATSRYNLYDMDKSYGCVCDPEYHGNDCSLRRCYRNDDPLTPVTTRRGVSEKLSEQNEVQILRVGCAHNGQVKSGSTLRLTYTDVQFGEKYTTAPFDPTDGNAAATLLELLRGLPNQVLGTSSDYHKLVSVTRDTVIGVNGNPVYRFFITFHTSLGNVPTLQITDGVKCTAGIELPSGYKSDAWNEVITPMLIGDGPVEDTLVTFTVDTDDTGTNPDLYTYKVEVGGLASSVASAPIQFPALAANPVYVDGTSLPGQTTSLLKAKFSFSRDQGDGADDQRVAGSFYKIQFYAPAAQVSIATQMHNISATFPITYRAVSNTGNYLYLEYISPYDVPDVDPTVLHIKITGTGAPDSWSWAINSGGYTAGGSAATSWTNLDDGTATVTNMEKLKIAFGMTTGHTLNEVWSAVINPHKISSYDSDDASDEYLSLFWVDAEDLPIDQLDVVLWITGHDAVVGDRYQWTLNGVNMGEYVIQPVPQFLGGYIGEASKFRVNFGGGKSTGLATRVGRSWRFSLIKLPIQSAWAASEVLRVHYFHTSVANEAARLSAVPTKNLGIVIDLVNVGSTTDTFRWKLVTDENWIATGPFTATPSYLPSAALHPTEASELQKLLFSFSGGVDFVDRSDTDTMVNGWYYVQFGQEGINDFVMCSDRGVCDESTGECKCFSGYHGEDCHEQHALFI